MECFTIHFHGTRRLVWAIHFRYLSTCCTLSVVESFLRIVLVLLCSISSFFTISLPLFLKVAKPFSCVWDVPSRLSEAGCFVTSSPVGIPPSSFFIPCLDWLALTSIEFLTAEWGVVCPTLANLCSSFVLLATGETIFVTLVSLLGDDFLPSLPFGGEYDSGCFYSTWTEAWVD